MAHRPSDENPDPPVTVAADGSVTTKFFWWGGRKASNRLKVIGTKVDGSGKPLKARIAPGSTDKAPHFWATRITFRSTGCWRVIATAGKKARLKFVTAVVEQP